MEYPGCSSRIGDIEVAEAPAKKLAVEWNPVEAGEETDEARPRLAVKGWASSVVWVIPCCLHLANLNRKAALDNKLDTVSPPASLKLLPI